MIYEAQAEYQPVRRSYLDAGLSFLLGVVTVVVIWVSAFMTYSRFIGWINEPVITPIATEAH